MTHAAGYVGCLALCPVALPAWGPRLIHAPPAVHTAGYSVLSVVSGGAALKAGFTDGAVDAYALPPLFGTCAVNPTLAVTVNAVSCWSAGDRRHPRGSVSCHLETNSLVR